MSTAAGMRPVSTTMVDDYDAIRDVVQLCLDGEAKGDVAKLQEAFHKDAWMFGELAGTRYDVPIQTLFDMAAEGPADTGNYRSRILSITHVGDVATATVAEEGYWGRCPLSTSSVSAASRAPGRSSTRPSPTSAVNRLPSHCAGRARYVPFFRRWKYLAARGDRLGVARAGHRAVPKRASNAFHASMASVAPPRERLTVSDQPLVVLR